jgi:hypothetical protein
MDPEKAGRVGVRDFSLSRNTGRGKEAKSLPRLSRFLASLVWHNDPIRNPGPEKLQ